MHGSVSLALLQLGDFEGALAEAELEPEPWFRFHCLALANYALGRQTEFERAFDESKSLNGEWTPVFVAAVYAYTGDADAAFEWLERVNPNVYGRGVATDASYANVLDDPRWAAWVGRMDPSMEELAAISFEVRPPR